MSTVYLNGQFLPLEQAHISPLDRGFLYADSIYEVIRAYRGKPFLLDEHFGRVADCLAKMRMGIHLSPLKDVPARLLAENGLTGDALIYIQVTRGAPPVRSHAFPPPEVKATVFSYAWGFTPNAEWADPGVAILLVPDDRWARCDIKVTALTPNVLANQRARDHGCHEAVYVREGVLTEGTHNNFFAVFDGEVRTLPLTNHILPGITRAAVLDLCRQHGIPARETPIFDHELPDAEELFITGTVAEVAPVNKLDGRQLSKERPVTDRIRRLFRELVERETA
jgi:D-alanine transaminase